MFHRKIYIAFVVIFSIASIIGFFGYLKNDDIPILGLGASDYNQCPVQCSSDLCYPRSSKGSKTRSKITPLVDSAITGTEYLDSFTADMFLSCVSSKRALLMYKNKQSEIGNNYCRKTLAFLNRTSPIIALVSFPGSGNSWVRHLLEQATGVYTGSIYCDTTLKAFFPGEHVVSGNVIAVKTHHSDSFDLPGKVQKHTGKTKFEKAILIVRNPFDALLSEANRQWSDVQKTEKHLGLAKESNFIGNVKWEWFAEYKGFSWFMMLNTWLKESHIPVLVIQYEKLVMNATQEIIKMANFLEMPVTNELLRCLSANNKGHFKRVQHLNFDPYSKELKQITNRIIEKGNAILKDYDIQYEPRHDI